MTTRRPELARRGLTVVWLVLVWLLLWGQLRADLVVGGVLVAVVVLRWSRLPPLQLRTRTRWRRVPRLVVRFAVDLVRSSWEVAVATFRAGRGTHSSVLALRLPGDVSDTADQQAAERVREQAQSLVDHVLATFPARERDGRSGGVGG
jgi:multisubunit Na+/H+ antiporter MnhE subunit